MSYGDACKILLSPSGVDVSLPSHIDIRRKTAQCTCFHLMPLSNVFCMYICIDNCAFAPLPPWKKILVTSPVLNRGREICMTSFGFKKTRPTKEVQNNSNINNFNLKLTFLNFIDLF